MMLKDVFKGDSEFNWEDFEFYSQMRHIFETALKDLNRARLEYEATRPDQDQPPPEMVLIDPVGKRKIKIKYRR